MAVCSNCGGSEFLWADAVRTGFVGRGKLALRSRGELQLGTRICRSCGHADLFLRDPQILKEPHRWKDGEFRPHHSPTIAPPPAPSPASPPNPTPSLEPAPAPPVPETTPDRGAEPELALPAVGEVPAVEPKRPPRRRPPTKGKTSAPPIIHD